MQVDEALKDESLKHSLFAAYNTNYTSDQGEAAVRVEWLRPHASGWPRAHGPASAGPQQARAHAAARRALDKGGSGYEGFEAAIERPGRQYGCRVCQGATVRSCDVPDGACPNQEGC